MRLCLAFLGFCLIVGVSSSRRRITCPRNRVSRQAFLDNIATSEDFFGIYTIELNSPDTYGRAINRFSVNPDGTVLFFTSAWNEDQLKCEDFESPDGVLSVVNEWRTSKCCRGYRGRPLPDSYVMINSSSIGFAGRRIVRFISQDPSNYFWVFQCFEGTVDSIGSCKFGYFDLQIPARNMLQEDIDLTGLKWDKIAEDLYEFTGLTFDNAKVEVKYTWKGDITSTSPVVLPSPCTPSTPCQNGGTCYMRCEAPGYKCVCREGYTGNDCEFGGDG